MQGFDFHALVHHRPGTVLCELPHAAVVRRPHGLWNDEGRQRLAQRLVAGVAKDQFGLVVPFGHAARAVERDESVSGVAQYLAQIGFIGGQAFLHLVALGHQLVEGARKIAQLVLVVVRGQRRIVFGRMVGQHVQAQTLQRGELAAQQVQAQAPHQQRQNDGAEPCEVLNTLECGHRFFAGVVGADDPVGLPCLLEGVEHGHPQPVDALGGAFEPGYGTRGGLVVPTLGVKVLEDA